MINHHYLEKHKKELGETSSISKYGYPDMGCGIYGDLLAYPDWIRMNNAQRAHEGTYGYLPFILANSILGGISYPRISGALLVWYLIVRQVYINSYHSSQGYGKAGSYEQACTGVLLFMSFLSIASGF